MNNTLVQDKLFQLASQTYAKAYAPYSKFKVGAAIESSSGYFYTGCNVENISYPCGTCAEAGAIAAMVAGSDKLIQQILILADSQELITPCGACLQRIKEFSNEHTVILLANLNGIQKSLKIKDLLPHAFYSQEI